MNKFFWFFLLLIMPFVLFITFFVYTDDNKITPYTIFTSIETYTSDFEDLPTLNETISKIKDTLPTANYYDGDDISFWETILNFLMGIYNAIVYLIGVVIFLIQFIRYIFLYLFTLFGILTGANVTTSLMLIP